MFWGAPIILRILSLKDKRGEEEVILKKQKRNQQSIPSHLPTRADLPLMGP